VQADVDPGSADAEEARAESEACAERRLRRRRPPPHEQQAGEGDERQREYRERGEGADGQRACGKSRSERGERRLEDRFQALPGSRCT